MEIINNFLKKNEDTGLLIMRLGIALLFLYGGVGKLFGILGGPGLEAFSGMVWGSMALAVFVGVVELIAGITVLLGFMTRESNLLLAIIIAVATIKIHIPSGDIMNVLIHIMLFTNLLGLVFIGSGEYSLKKD